MTSPDVCRRCTANGTGCCTSTNGVPLAPLLETDLARISQATGLQADAFVTTRPIDEEEREALWDDDPVLRGLSADGVIRSLRIQDGACVFLGPEGCTLGSARPLLCRRFPFVRRERGRIAVNPGGECLACDEAQSLPELLQLLGSSPAKLRTIDRAIRRSLDPANEGTTPTDG